MGQYLLRRHKYANGTKRHFAVVRKFGRFRRKAELTALLAEPDLSAQP